jgi:hypothetical protein
MVVMSGAKSEIRASAVARRTCELVRMRRHVGFRAGRAGLGAGGGSGRLPDRDGFSGGMP